MAGLTFPQWLDRITQQHRLATAGKGIRILPFAESMQLVELSCPVVVVAGTNGKGSVVALLESIFSDYRVGVYTSPHLHQFNERVRVNQAPLSDAELIEAFDAVSHDVTTALSFFEFVTLAALYAFQQRDLDLVILEVGLGGRLDPVNVVKADVSVITSLGMDHEDRLGNTLEAIAYEKAGIFKPGEFAVCGASSPPSVVAQQAALLRVAEFAQIGKDYCYDLVEGEGKKHWQYRSHGFIGLDDGVNFPCPILRLDHAATAIKVTELLELSVSIEKISTALENTVLAGRFERWENPVPVIFDVAHNAQAAAYLRVQLDDCIKGKVLAVVAMRQNKCSAATLRPLLSKVKRWYAADLDEDNGDARGQVYGSLLDLQVRDCVRFDSVSEAVRQAVNDFHLLDVQVILVFGSFHTVKQAQLILQ